MAHIDTVHTDMAHTVNVAHTERWNSAKKEATDNLCHAPSFILHSFQFFRPIGTRGPKRIILTEHNYRRSSHAHFADQLKCGGRCAARLEESRSALRIRILRSFDWHLGVK
jgi:hypothetical protein